jgi:amino acid permease
VKCDLQPEIHPLVKWLKITTMYMCVCFFLFFFFAYLAKNKPKYQINKKIAWMMKNNRGRQKEKKRKKKMGEMLGQQ